MSQDKINIALLLGDPSGIGPELVSKLLSEEITNNANIVIIGEKNILENGNKISGKSIKLNYVENFEEINFKKYNKFFLDISKGKNHQYNLSECSKESGESVLSALNLALKLAKEKKVHKYKIKQSTVYSLLKKLHDKNEIYRKSGAVHGCALCDNNEILDFVEDVGRHNAVDAIAGHMWLNELEGYEKIFYTTGRLTSEMVIKVAQMNISVLLSRSGITEMGLNVAKDTNVTLLGRAKGRHFLVYNGKENIEFDAIPDPRPEGSADIWKRR